MTAWEHGIENGEPWDSYVQASNDIGEIPSAVCMTHMRFVPCRKGNREGGCAFSQNPEDVRAVTDYHFRKWLDEGK